MSIILGVFLIIQMQIQNHHYFVLIYPTGEIKHVIVVVILFTMDQKQHIFLNLETQYTLSQGGVPLMKLKPTQLNAMIQAFVFNRMNLQVILNVVWILIFVQYQ